MRSIADAISSMLAEAALVSRGQWVLRLLAVAAMVLILVLMFPAGPIASLPSAALAGLIALLVLAQSITPDSDIASALPIVIGLPIAVADPLPLWRMVVIGAALVLAHMCWAWAASAPAHAELTAPAWRAMLRSGALVLLVSLLLGMLLLLVAMLHVPNWAVVFGVVALIGLMVALLPLVPRGERC